MSELGKHFKAIRLSNNLSLRAFCRKYGIDQGNLSKMERGLLSFPNGITLDQYLESIDVKKSSDAWFKMHDLAAIERGALPKYIVDDESLLSRMPLFFLLSRKFKECENKDEFLLEFKSVIKEDLK